LNRPAAPGCLNTVEPARDNAVVPTEDGRFGAPTAAFHHGHNGYAMSARVRGHDGGAVAGHGLGGRPDSGIKRLEHP